MALGHLHQPEATLEQLTQDAQICGVQISASGLHQRCTEQAAAAPRKPSLRSWWNRW